MKLFFSRKRLAAALLTLCCLLGLAACSSDSKTYYADIQIQDYGTITVQLDSSAAPQTVANFVALAKRGVYDGTTFHRIIENFMMQGGYSEKVISNVRGEFSANGHNNPLSHVRGTISMARAEDYNSATSQFFIVHQDSIYLDGKYAAFGKVLSGMDIVDKICTEADPTDLNGSISVSEQPVITTITIRTEA